MWRTIHTRNITGQNSAKGTKPRRWSTSRESTKYRLQLQEQVQTGTQIHHKGRKEARKEGHLTETKTNSRDEKRREKKRVSQACHDESERGQQCTWDTETLRHWDRRGASLCYCLPLAIVLLMIVSGLHLGCHGPCVLVNCCAGGLALLLWAGLLVGWLCCCGLVMAVYGW